MLPLKEQFSQKMCHQNEACAEALNAVAFLTMSLHDQSHNENQWCFSVSIVKSGAMRPKASFLN